MSMKKYYNFVNESNEDKFEIGDRVRYIGKYSDNDFSYYGRLAYVKSVLLSGGYKIEFDNGNNIYTNFVMRDRKKEPEQEIVWWKDGKLEESRGQEIYKDIMKSHDNFEVGDLCKINNLNYLGNKKEWLKKFIGLEAKIIMKGHSELKIQFDDGISTWIDPRSLQKIDDNIEWWDSKNEDNKDFFGMPTFKRSQTFKIGDIVRINCRLQKYHNKTGTIIEIDKSPPTRKYGSKGPKRTSLYYKVEYFEPMRGESSGMIITCSWFMVGQLEHYEPKKNPDIDPYCEEIWESKENEESIKWISSKNLEEYIKTGDRIKHWKFGYGSVLKNHKNRGVLEIKFDTTGCRDIRPECVVPPMEIKINIRLKNVLKKREEFRLKMLDIDPYSEEIWE